MNQPVDVSQRLPDANGLFGSFGGRFVAETLMPLILELQDEYATAKNDPEFQRQLAYFQGDYVGRPSPLYFAERLTEHFCGASIYLKREELNHTGAHKINNCIGQVLLAKQMGKSASSRKPVRACTALPPLPLRRALVCLVSSIWAQPTSSVSSPTYSA
ncbi:hypothetical protein HORIV_47480 [Vreelandella olivaria]|uniref:Tryptophan synthase n=1 Tax=Vreelandella olivaria TaxID=390919 RepID=A0ABN5X2K7_9GAMM|nr:hypothetical protein HORIV_47480 [Halomonas olivaria]